MLAYKGIQAMREYTEAPVDTQGAAQQGDPNDSPENFRFQTLVGLMLSSQTKDPITHATMERFREFGCNVPKVRKTSEKKIREVIHGVGFHNTKAKHIKQVAEILHEDYNGDVPSTYKEVIALPGVGPKMTILYLQIAEGVVTGISVDTHVHRIANRLKWVKSTNPEGTRQQLEKLVPEPMWDNVNKALVGFGQAI